MQEAHGQAHEQERYGVRQAGAPDGATRRRAQHQRQKQEI